MRRAGQAFAWIAILAAACAPDQAFHNPCDPEAPEHDACACLRLTAPCPVGTACRVRDGVASCECDHAWCPAEGLDRVCCAPGMICKDGACCLPGCGDAECGFDRCGLPCGPLGGECPCGHVCTDDQRCRFVACDRETTEPPFVRQCGPDGCGGTCGEGCPTSCGIYCNDEGLCQFDPCHDRECGPDDCLDGDCGECPAETPTCDHGRCVAP